MIAHLKRAAAIGGMHVKRIAGVRTTFLLIMSLGAVIRGWAYLPGIGPYDPPSALRLLPDWIPLGVWGVLWMLVGVFGGVVALTGFKHPEGARYAGFALMLMGILWGTTYIGSYGYSLVEGSANREWFSGAILMTTAIGTAAGAVMSIRLTIAMNQIEALQAEAVVYKLELSQARRQIEDLQEQLRNGQ